MKKPNRKKKKVTWPKGIITINFPVHSKGDFYADIKKIREFYDLPKYRAIGFKHICYEETKDHPAFCLSEVFIEK